MIIQGTDKIFLDTALPSPLPPCLSTQPMMAQFEASKGSGLQFVMDNLAGICPDAQIEVLDTVDMDNSRVIRKGVLPRS